MDVLLCQSLGVNLVVVIKAEELEDLVALVDEVSGLFYEKFLCFLISPVSEIFDNFCRLNVIIEFWMV